MSTDNRANLERQLAKVLRDERSRGSTSIRDSRWPDRTARTLVTAMLREYDIVPKGVLEQEWGVQITEDGKTVIETHPGSGEPLTREDAFYENVRWRGFDINTEGVFSRLVSEWKREVDEQ